MSDSILQTDKQWTKEELAVVVSDESGERQFVEDLVGGAWASHSTRDSDRSARTLTLAGRIYDTVAEE
jgi:hypothetical protein